MITPTSSIIISTSPQNCQPKRRIFPWRCTSTTCSSAHWNASSHATHLLEICYFNQETILASQRRLFKLRWDWRIEVTHHRIWTTLLSTKNLRRFGTSPTPAYEPIFKKTCHRLHAFNDFFGRGHPPMKNLTVRRFKHHHDSNRKPVKFLLIKEKKFYFLSISTNHGLSTTCSRNMEALGRGMSSL